MRDERETTHVGDEWEFKFYIEDLKEKSRENQEKRRFLMAMLVMAGIALGALGLAVYGVWVGSFAAVIGFWAATGSIFGAIIGFYFGKNGDDPRK
jgi:hypothetical protein